MILQIADRNILLSGFINQVRILSSIIEEEDGFFSDRHYLLLNWFVRSLDTFCHGMIDRFFDK